MNRLALHIILFVFCLACTPAKDKLIQQNKNHWIVFDTKDSKLHDGACQWIAIKSLKLANGEVQGVSLPGQASQQKWEQSNEALEIDQSGLKKREYAYALEITLKD